MKMYSRVKDKATILITSIGRRVQLIQHLKKTFTVVGVDASEENAAKHFVDHFHKIPRCTDPGYVDALLEISLKHSVGMIVPLYEDEFTSLNEMRITFEQNDIQLLLSTDKIITICNNKYETQEFFRRNSIKAPKITEHAPAVIKPAYGMGSSNVYFAENDDDLSDFKKRVENPIIQERIIGQEYTIDVLCDFHGKVISVVPRERLEVRSGEVSKTRTVKHDMIIHETILLIHKLNHYGTVIGPMTVQCFLTQESEIIFLEINPRFGGGVPLSFEAGVDYGMYLDQCLSGKQIEPVIGQFKEMKMMRYDMAVYEEI